MILYTIRIVTAFFFESQVLRIVGRFPGGQQDVGQENVVTRRDVLSFPSTGKPAPIANARGCAVLPTTLLPQELPALLRTNRELLLRMNVEQ